MHYKEKDKEKQLKYYDTVCCHYSYYARCTGDLTVSSLDLGLNGLGLCLGLGHFVVFLGKALSVMYLSMVCPRVGRAGVVDHTRGI